MDNLDKLIHDYFNRNISIKLFYNRLLDIHNDVNIENFINNFIDSNLSEDQIMFMFNITLLIYNSNNDKLYLKNLDNPYLIFIKNDLNDYLDNNKVFNVIDIDDFHLTAKLDNIYLILNGKDTDQEIIVPVDIQNKTVYCINCGDEIDLEESVELYPDGFYLIEK